MFSVLWIFKIDGTFSIRLEIDETILMLSRDSEKSIDHVWLVNKATFPDLWPRKLVVLKYTDGNLKVSGR
jgi:hypothetical protein